jgi:peptidoglycan/LPS O-acetylase OafA/YrhL
MATSALDYLIKLVDSFGAFRYRWGMNLPKHMPALDGLRGLAILMVLMDHVSGGWASAWSVFPGNYESAPSLLLPDWLRAIADGMANGVSLFFVVSAFTLTIRATYSDGDLRHYALRRLARVGPGYWIAGLTYTLAAGLAPRLWAPVGISSTDLIVAAVFGSAWGGGASLAVVPGGWSVSCEVAFYVALPVLTRMIDGRIWRSIMLTGLALMVAQVRARHAMLVGVHNFPFHVNPIEQAPVFLCGVTAALASTRLRLPHLPGVSVALAVIAIVALPFSPIPTWHLLPNALFGAVVAIAVALAAAHPPALLANRVMRRIGEVSYSMYLVHFALLATSLRMAEWLIPALDVRTMLLHFAFTLVGSFALASVTYRYVEMPAIRWAAKHSRLR